MRSQLPPGASKTRCMLLVYEYMERGSLFRVLHNDNEAIELDWAKRLKVIKELEAFVADFGMTMHLYCDSSNLTLLAGTYGYGAPDKLFRFSCFFIILKFKSNNISASFVGL
ncbi:hypothetical protein WN944_026389 [Citrus x changshan-huyou]|uniref:non-specific serine/threonine protein kinase n=1 Tax=Citrus x changshan-huyou TaxID=2935761 RepID=A0AAP0LSB2_9ROSI